MTIQQRCISILLYSLLCFTLEAWSEEPVLLKGSIFIDVENKARLQRGAQLFINYCSGCHSLKYLRYNRMAEDLGITNEDGSINENSFKKNLIFTKTSISSPILTSMSSADAKQWFGVAPPDLSLSARSRGPLWIYNYLHAFYQDDSRPFGTNNVLLQNTAMPDIFSPLIGKKVYLSMNSSTGSHLFLIEDGLMTQEQFDNAVLDLVSFLVYAGEPSRLMRYKIGVFVLLYLFVFLVIAYNFRRRVLMGLK